MIGLTHNEVRVLNFLCAAKVTPTFRELQKAMGYKHAQSIGEIVGQLERKGHVLRAGEARKAGARKLQVLVDANGRDLRQEVA